MKKGTLFVFSGPSGSGKSTICEYLKKIFPDIKFSISVTTRNRRGKEVHGVEYFFISKEEFIERRDNKEFIEWAEVHGNYYGTLWSTVHDFINRGENLLLDIDVTGGFHLKKRMPEAILNFIMPPSLEILRKRLETRSTDSEEVINKRLKNAVEEINKAEFYDNIIINDVLEDALEKISGIVKENIQKGNEESN